MAVRKASAVWEGRFREGKGHLALGSGAYEGPYSFSTRFEDAPGTNPEELLGAAEAACFSMALGASLERAGHVPERIATSARVHLESVDNGFSITKIELDCEARVPGVDEETFQQHAENNRAGCIVARALAVDILLNARLIN